MAMRLAVTYIFITVHEAPEDEKDRNMKICPIPECPCL
jgi:hypothetical protein